MQDFQPTNEYLAALQQIAEEISQLRKTLSPEIPSTKTEEQEAEDLKRIKHEIFGD